MTIVVTTKKSALSVATRFKKGDILIEGASIAGGEIALGKNLLVAFMPWGGYNMEDAIIMSRRLVEGDRLTSINIKDYTVEVRETKLGPEIVTRDIPNVSEEVCVTWMRTELSKSVPRLRLAMFGW